MTETAVRFIHTSDIHLGKTYRTSPGERERYDDFFRAFGAIVADAVRERVDFVLVGGDLFHTGQILPKTFARTIEALQPLKDAGIPCIAVEGRIKMGTGYFSVTELKLTCPPLRGWEWR